MDRGVQRGPQHHRCSTFTVKLSVLRPWRGVKDVDSSPMGPRSSPFKHLMIGCLGVDRLTRDYRMTMCLGIPSSHCNVTSSSPFRLSIPFLVISLLWTPTIPISVDQHPDSAMSTTYQIHTAYNNPSADVVLTSNEKVDFKVLSHVFKASR